MGLFDAITSAVKATANVALVPLDFAKDVATGDLYDDEKKSSTRRRVEAIESNLDNINEELED